MNQTLKAYHWGFALFLAAVIHMGLLINYQPTVDNIAAPVTSKELVIGLKKLTTPPPPVVEKPVVIENKPEVKPKAVTKPKPKKKPQVIIPKVTKPVVAPVEKSAQVTPQPMVTQPKEQSSKPSNIPPQSSPDPNAIAKQKTAYLSQLARWLERHKQYPSIARRRNQQGEVVIQFTMNAQGKLLQHSIVKPSRHESLNKATRNMLEKAAPLPPVPPALRNGRTQFSYTIPVRFKLDK